MPQPDKLIAKIPMWQTVIDRSGAIFDYQIVDSKLTYIFKGYTMINEF